MTARTTTPAAELNARIASALKIQARIAKLERDLATMLESAVDQDLKTRPAPSASPVRKLRKPVAAKTPRTTTRKTLVAPTTPTASQHPELDKNTRGKRAQAVRVMAEHKALRLSAWYDLTDAGYFAEVLADMGEWEIFSLVDEAFGDVLTWAHATIAVGRHDAIENMGGQVVRIA